MNTLNLIEAASFLRMNPQVLRRKASDGIIPGRKTGKCWLFIEDHLADWVSGRYADPAKKLLVDDAAEEKQCQSTSVVKRGTSSLRTTTETEYNNLLILKTGKRR